MPAKIAAKVQTEADALGLVFEDVPETQRIRRGKFDETLMQVREVLVKAPNRTVRLPSEFKTYEAAANHAVKINNGKSPIFSDSKEWEAKAVRDKENVNEVGKPTGVLYLTYRPAVEAEEV